MAFTDTQIKDSINRVIKFVNEKKRLPQSVRVGKSVLPLTQYLALAQLKDAKKRAINFRDVKERCANYVNICNVQVPKNIYIQLFSMSCTVKKPTNTTNKPSTPKPKTRFVSTPHLTTSAQGIGQDTPYNCADNCLQQSFYKLTGKVVKESIIASWAGTTSKGTSHDGINTAVAKFNKTYGTNLKVTWKNFSDFGKTDNEKYTNVGKLLERKDTSLFFHIGYRNGGDNCNTEKIFGHYEYIDIINTKTKYVRALNSLGKKRGNGYYGFLQNRPFRVQNCFIKAISQKSVCIITK